ITCGQATIYRYIRGECEVGASTLAQIMDALGLEIRDAN
ncbi:unnamed protein product, partial [marine sediment metagenome]